VQTLHWAPMQDEAKHHPHTRIDVSPDQVRLVFAHCEDNDTKNDFFFAIVLDNRSFDNF
jgi:hypothetical protein